MQVSPTSHATAALKRLVVARVITSFTTNFERREVGFAPRVEVATEAQDELSLARVRRRIEHELVPLLGRVAISVVSEQRGKSSPGRGRP